MPDLFLAGTRSQAISSLHANLQVIAMTESRLLKHTHMRPTHRHDQRYRQIFFLNNAFVVPFWTTDTFLVLGDLNSVFHCPPV